MKKTILTTIFVVLLITTCAFSLVGCDFPTPDKDGKEVEITDAVSGIRRGVGTWAESGAFLGVPLDWINNPAEPADLLKSGIEAKPYSTIRLEWNNKVSNKYKITRFTFDFFTTKLDTEFKIQISGSDLLIAELKQFTLNIEPAIESVQEINFGEAGLKTETWLGIGAKGINNTPHGYLWKLSNFKVYGIKL